MAEKFSERLKEALELRRMRPKDLSDKTGLAKSAISGYLHDKYEPKQEAIYKMAKALMISPLQLLGLEELPKEKAPTPIVRQITAEQTSVLNRDIKEYSYVGDDSIFYAFLVPDDGMARAGIKRRSLVFVSDEPVQHNDIVVVNISGQDAVVRRYCDFGRGLVLREEIGEDIIDTPVARKDIKIRGKVKYALFTL